VLPALSLAVAFLAAAALMAGRGAGSPWAARPRLGSDRPSGTKPAPGVVGPAERISAPHRAASRALLILLLVLLYRWPDDCWGLMVCRYFDSRKALRRSGSGTVQGGLAASAATMGRHVLGPCCLRALAEPLAVRLFSIAGAIGNLSYVALARLAGCRGCWCGSLEKPGGRMVGSGVRGLA